MSEYVGYGIIVEYFYRCDQIDCTTKHSLYLFQIDVHMKLTFAMHYKKLSFFLYYFKSSTLPQVLNIFSNFLCPKNKKYLKSNKYTTLFRIFKYPIYLFYLSLYLNILPPFKSLKYKSYMR